MSENNQEPEKTKCRKKREQPTDPTSLDAPQEDFFATSWGDTITLLLVFFIFLFSISSVDKMKYGEVVRQVKTYLNSQGDDAPGESQAGEHGGGPQSDTYDQYLQEQELLKNIYSQLNKVVGDENLEDVVDINIGPDQISLNVGNTLLFDIGSATLKERAKYVLAKIASLIQISNSDIIVEGHTDDTPINTALFPSNWELSSSRAAAVVRFMRTQGIPEYKFSVLGYSSFRPLTANATEKQRSHNRRVTIILKANIEAMERIATESVRMREDYY